MTEKSIIITACDSSYFALAMDLVMSIRDKVDLSDMPIGVLDLGLMDDEKSRLEKFGVEIRNVGWDIEFPAQSKWQNTLPGYKAMVSRSFLRDHFPGYSVYVWMDADTWLQREEAIPSIVQAAPNRGLIIAAEFDRQYKQLLDGPALWQVFRNWYCEAFGEQLANWMNLRPMLNCGVFALSSDAPHWNVWRQIHREALQRNEEVTPVGFMLEQLALNVAVYLRGLEFQLLPVGYNWLCHLATPKWDSSRELFLERSIPNEPISIMHLSQQNKLGALQVSTVGGGEAQDLMSLRYPGAKAE